MKGHFASRKEITMSSVEHRSPLEKSVPLIYLLQRWFFAACIVLGAAATLVMVATNPGYYNSQTGEAGLLAGYASANVVMVQIHLISAVITFYNIVDIPGVVLGPALIGLALWRARAVPIWSAVLITFSRLVVFLFPFFPSLPGVYLQFPSCLLLFVGSIPAARAVLRTLSEERQSTPNKEAHFPGATLS